MLAQETEWWDNPAGSSTDLGHFQAPVNTTSEDLLTAGGSCKVLGALGAVYVTSRQNQSAVNGRWMVKLSSGLSLPADEKHCSIFAFILFERE